MFNFTDQVVIVTGGTRGIGGAITAAFLSAGATVLATYARNHAAATAFKAAQGSQADNLNLHNFDITHYKSVKSFFEKIETEYNQIHICINNAGIRQDAVLAMMPPEQWQQVIDTNLTGTYHMCKFAVQAMMKHRYGRIINITSPSGEHGFAGQANYAASKAGQVALTKSLAKEVAKRNITVNCVSPGFVETELIADLSTEQKKLYKNQVPLKRFGTPAEIAAGVLFLASQEASYITGTVLEITGGL
ncbi:MAG: SDR family oxidoreductase [Gemmatimonadetes bacterium]|nr:MAG: SDR family oxidoreductase [Gemmatimonadota bacterium]